MHRLCIVRRFRVSKWWGGLGRGGGGEGRAGTRTMYSFLEADLLKSWFCGFCGRSMCNFFF